MQVELLGKWGGKSRVSYEKQTVLAQKVQKTPYLHKVKPIRSSFHIEAKLSQKLLLYNVQKEHKYQNKKGYEILMT